jgi:Transposase
MTGSVMKATGGTEPAIREPETTVDHCETSYEVRVFLNNPTANASTPQSDGEVAAAWQGKELLRAVYAAVGMPAARAALERFSRWADSVGVVELSRLARTIRAWQAEILAWHVTDGCSNGPTEAVNLLIKKIKRIGRLS